MLRSDSFDDRSKRMFRQHTEASRQDTIGDLSLRLGILRTLRAVLSSMVHRRIRTRIKEYLCTAIHNVQHEEQEQPAIMQPVVSMARSLDDIFCCISVEM